MNNKPNLSANNQKAILTSLRNEAIKNKANGIFFNKGDEARRGEIESLEEKLGIDDMPLKPTYQPATIVGTTAYNAFQPATLTPIDGGNYQENY